VMHLDGRQPDNDAPGYLAPKIMGNQYRCGDGKFLQLQTTNMVKLLRVIGREDVTADPRCKGAANRVKNGDWICTELAKTFLEKPRDEWLAMIDANNVGPAGPVNTYKDVMEHEQNWANGYVVRQTDPNVPGAKPEGDIVVGKVFKFSKSPAGPVERGPELGEHNDWILKDTLGFSQAEVDGLAKADVINLSPNRKPPMGPLAVDANDDGVMGKPARLAQSQQSKL